MIDNDSRCPPQRPVTFWCAFGGGVGLLFLLIVHYYLIIMGFLWAHRVIWTMVPVIIVTSTAGVLYAAWGRWNLFVDAFVGIFVGVAFADFLHTRFFPFESGNFYYYLNRTLESPLRDICPGLLMYCLAVLGASIGAGVGVRTEDDSEINVSCQHADSRLQIDLAFWCVAGGALGLLALLAVYSYMLTLGPLVAYQSLGLESRQVFHYAAIVATVGGGLYATRARWNLFASTFLGIFVGDTLGGVLAGPLFPLTSQSVDRHIISLSNDPLTDFYPAFPIFGMTVFGACLGSVTTLTTRQASCPTPECYVVERRVKMKASIACAIAGAIGLLLLLACYYYIVNLDPLRVYDYLTGRNAILPIMLIAIYVVSAGAIDVAWKRLHVFLHIVSWACLGTVLGVPPWLSSAERPEIYMDRLSHDSLSYFYPALPIFGAAVFGAFVGATCDSALLRWYQRWFAPLDRSPGPSEQPILFKYIVRLLALIAMLIVGGYLSHCTMSEKGLWPVRTHR